MKKWLLIAVVMTLATAALADTVTLKLVSTYTGGPIGPYTFDVNGTSVQQLVCGSDLNNITVGESWTAQVYGINNVTSNPYFTTPSQDDWNRASVFADLLLTHPGNAYLQNAVWATLGLPVGPIDAGWASVVDAFFAAHSGYQTPDLFYIPVVADYDAAHGYPYGIPQPFIGTPEPSSLMLFGSGLMAAAGLVRRRMRA